MQSTVKLRESDPHDAFAITPDIVPAAWADKVLADITEDTGPAPADQPVAPVVDTTFRATAVADLHVANDTEAEARPTGRLTKSAIMLVFGLCSAAAAAAWQHHGDTARQMIANMMPAFAQGGSQSPQPAGPTAQADTPAVLTAASDAAAPGAALPQAAENAAPAAASDATQLQSMARDVAAMGQEIAVLKATLAELRASQQASARPPEPRSSEVKPVVQNPRPKLAAVQPPPRPAAPVRRPTPATYAPVQTAPPPMPLGTTPSATWQPPPPLPAAREADGEAVVRPPMPLR